MNPTVDLIETFIALDAYPDNGQEPSRIVP
jgi:hypothetical protein